MAVRRSNEKKEQNMKCFICKGMYENKVSTFMVEIGNMIIIIRDVPSQVCAQCGEVSYDTDVAKHLESIVNSLKETTMEIAIVHYPDIAA